MLVTLPDVKDQKDADAQLPTSQKQKHTQYHHRSRSSSLAATFNSSATVPPTFTPFESEALSSLISSLTLISDAHKTPSTGVPATKPPTPTSRRDLIDQLAINPNLPRTFDPIDVTLDGDERDYCPPPVAGYNTINAVSLPARPKTAGNDRATRKPKAKPFTLKLAKSNVNTRAASLKSPTFSLSHNEPRPSYNGSVASLPLSTKSKVSGSKSPFRSFFSIKMGGEQNAPDHVPPRLPSDASFESRPSLEKERDPHRFSAFVRIENIKTDVESMSSDTRTQASISPVNRIDLNETLIPSRRSSLRSNRGRPDRGSRDLKSLNIDQDLIEENHETVQRIRELQQARERRHHEWRKEARRSEKAAKRLTMPATSPAQSPVKMSTSVRSSWHSKMAGTPESGESLELHAHTTGDDLPVETTSKEPVERPATMVSERALGGCGTEMQRQPSTTTSTTPSIPSVKRHRQRLSESIKRASSIRQPVSDDAKGVSDEVDGYLGSPRFTQKIRHPRTGRTIAFSEVGDSDGFVVLCCVGMGLTRYVTSFYDEIAKAQKLRIITPDRPGVGETEPMPAERTTPLAWVDDVAVICASLGIDKFSILAHSAGAIYALATALKMPQFVRGRIHLLAPWVPPSQFPASGHNKNSKTANLPTSHKLLSFLPTSFMKAANSRFLSATSASLEPRSRKDRKGDKSLERDPSLDLDLFGQEASLSRADISQHNYYMLPYLETASSNDYSANYLQNYSSYHSEHHRSPPRSPTPVSVTLIAQRTSTMSPSPSVSGARTPNSYTRVMTPQARTRLYNTSLTTRTWTLSTLNANPAVDLIICLERRRPIGFRYTDITRSVVIHHGAGDTRVPVENVRWLSGAMKRCELRILEGEGHGLMASAAVMSEVLGEVGREWEEWAVLNREREKERKREEEIIDEVGRGVRKGYPRW